MKKVLSEMVLPVVIVCLFVAMFLFSGCEMAQTGDILENADETAGNATSRQVTTIATFRFYDDYDGTGNYFTIWIRYHDGAKFLESSLGGYFDPNDFTAYGGWNDRVKSITMGGMGYPEIYVFENAHTVGGEGLVIKVIAQTTNIPAGFGISSVVPVPPYSYHTEQTVNIYTYESSVQKYLCADVANVYGRPILPNRTAVGAWETFTLRYIDAYNRFFTLYSPDAGLYVCSDLHVHSTHGPLYANRSTPDYWELFKISNVISEVGNTRRVTLDAVSSGYRLWAYGETTPIGAYGGGYSDEFYIYNY